MAYACKQLKALRVKMVKCKIAFVKKMPSGRCFVLDGYNNDNNGELQLNSVRYAV
jgi:hypothetical protein